MTIDRRNFCALAGGGLASMFVSSGCQRLSSSTLPRDGRLTARPKATTKTTSTRGRIALGLASKRDAILSIPKLDSPLPLPLLVMFHGATQSAEVMFRYMDSAPENVGIAVLAPNSRDITWDAITDGFGTDIEFINRALERTFETAPIDPKRIILGGFSDGASYAISLGLINGDFSERVLAFSPGFVINGEPHGQPKLFISHGTKDHILPIDRCGRRIAQELRSRGYEVAFREFEGNHEIPSAVLGEALQWVRK